MSNPISDLYRGRVPTAPSSHPLLGCCLAGVLLASSALAAPATPIDGWSAERPSRGGQAVKSSLTDPVEDTFGFVDSDIDLVGFSARIEGGALAFVIDFAVPIDAPGSGGANEINGYIDIDADQNGATGDAPFVDVLTTFVTGMGNEYYVDLGAFDAGTVAVWDDVTDSQVGSAPAVFDGSTLTVRVPLSLLGNDDGFVHTAVLVGTPTLPTDAAPNGGFLASSIAAGSTEALLNDNRFRVTIDWQATGAQPQPAFVSTLRTEDSGIFYFVDDQNLELLVKVLDGCAINDRYWVFVSAATDVGLEIEITDTQTGASRTYTNTLGMAAETVNDTQAFATCP
jgi:hypothetical protein